MSEVYPFPMSGTDRVSGSMSNAATLLDIAKTEQVRAVQAEAECISLADLSGRLGCVVSWVLANPGKPLGDTIEAYARVAVGDLEAKMRRCQSS